MRCGIFCPPRTPRAKRVFIIAAVLFSLGLAGFTTLLIITVRHNSQAMPDKCQVLSSAVEECTYMVGEVQHQSEQYVYEMASEERCSGHVYSGMSFDCSEDLGTALPEGYVLPCYTSKDCSWAEFTRSGDLGVVIISGIFMGVFFAFLVYIVFLFWCDNKEQASGQDIQEGVSLVNQ